MRHEKVRLLFFYFKQSKEGLFKKKYFLIRFWNLLFVFNVCILWSEQREATKEKTRAGSEEPITPVLTAIAVLTPMN